MRLLPSLMGNNNLAFKETSNQAHFFKKSFQKCRNARLIHPVSSNSIRKPLKGSMYQVKKHLHSERKLRPALTGSLSDYA